MIHHLPPPQGLYDPAHERDACGIGFVANIKGHKSHEIIRRGLEVLERMTHRGAESADNRTGDGAGIMLQVPHAYYETLVPNLPPPGHYGTGIVFVPRDPQAAEVCIRIFDGIVQDAGLSVLAWRDVPVDSSVLGEIARAAEPVIKQVFVARDAAQNAAQNATGADLERQLYVIRKQAEAAIRQLSLAETQQFYITNLSSKTVIYKGMLMPEQITSYFSELGDARMESAIALIHSRFSTNTFPTWDLAQPFRLVAHNGEINTVQGNRLWLQAREGELCSPMIGGDIRRIAPIIEPAKSDSASFDNVLELLVRAGRLLPARDVLAAAARKRLVAHLAVVRVLLHRQGEELDGFRCGVVGTLAGWDRRHVPDRAGVVVGGALGLLALDPAEEARLVLPHVPAARQHRAILGPDDLLVHERAIALPDLLQHRLAAAGVPAVPRGKPDRLTLARLQQAALTLASSVTDLQPERR